MNKEFGKLGLTWFTHWFGVWVPYVTYDYNCEALTKKAAKE